MTNELFTVLQHYHMVIADSTVPYLSLQSEMVTLWRIGMAIRGGLEAIYSSLHIEQ